MRLFKNVSLHIWKNSTLEFLSFVEFIWKLDISKRNTLSTHWVMDQDQEFFFVDVISQWNRTGKHGVITSRLSLEALCKSCSILSLDIDARLLHNSLMKESIIKLFTLLLSLILLLLVLHKCNLSHVTRDRIAALHGLDYIKKILLGCKNLRDLSSCDIGLEYLLGENLVFKMRFTWSCFYGPLQIRLRRVVPSVNIIGVSQRN